MGINNGLRVGDLLKLKVKVVRNLKIEDTLNIRESKAGKDNMLVINKAVHKSLKNYLEKVQPRNSDYLFACRKGNKAITIQAVNNLQLDHSFPVCYY
jgi:site-specific recombinase XerD